ncbi:MAG: Nif3-like dinuclear metal center hexameric protein [Clostridia bacterium]|nr:Nif3-like dinuclear metal center hexameric protein [Clostridia bacterium]
MKIGEILAAIDAFAPFATAQEWDNSGLLIGSPETAVTRALVCLDITDDAIAEAKRIGAELIVSHHPVIFHPLSSLTSELPAYRLVESGLSAIAAHTNLDVCDGGVGTCLAKTLGLTNIRESDEPFIKIGDLPSAMTANAFAAHCAKALGTAVRLHKGVEPITTVAVGGGSCGEFARAAETAGAEAFVSGEIRHHEYLGERLTLIEGGHYATEQPAIAPFAEVLKTACPSVEWSVYDIGEPYETVE